MSRKRQSLKVRAELYAQKHGTPAVMDDGSYALARGATSKAWRDGYLQARRDARKHTCLN